MENQINFTCNGQTIQGIYHPAVGESNAFPTINLLSGFPGNEEDVLGLGEMLSQHGMNVLTFNYRGIHRSEGEYSLANTQEDIEASFEFLLKEETIKEHRIDSNRLILGGWSYGGGMALIYAANHPEVSSVFSIAGTDHGEFAREYQKNETFSNMVDAVFEDVKHPNGPVKFAGKSAIRDELIMNPVPYDFLTHAAKLVNRNLLFIGGWDDLNVTIEDHILPGYRKLIDLGAKNTRLIAFQDSHAFEQSRSELTRTIMN